VAGKDKVLLRQKEAIWIMMLLFGRKKTTMFGKTLHCDRLQGMAEALKLPINLM
jgi:hypothetical protein